MQLQPGTTMLHYRLVEKIGEGGMGVVWKALDTTLDRHVAIKVLPEGLAQDNDRLLRFEREAKLLGSLNHPHIATIHGLHEHEGVRFLAMEFVDGPDLSQRLVQGALPRDEAVAIALQVARALETAHDNGVVHRDLKPANVKVTRDGTAKVLDFGLAKALLPDAASGEVSATQSPTVTSAGTLAGTLIGTAAYMSPEQARGRHADRRADVWAFGVVLFELLSGDRLFAGDTLSDVLAAVLREEPDLNRLPADTPVRLRRLIRRCLERDVARRLQAIGEARIVLEDEDSGQPTESADRDLASARAPRSNRLPWAIAAITLSLSIILLTVLALREPSGSERIVSGIPAPDGNAFAQIDGPPVLSPDGSHLAFVATDGEGRSRIFVRNLEWNEARPLAGTEDGQVPFWSPDGLRLAFFAGGFLKKVDLASGSPEVVTRAAGRAGGGTWNAEGTIIFGIQDTRPLRRVPAGGGEAQLLGVVHQGRQRVFYQWPSFLPDGEHVLFTVLDLEGGNSGVYVAPMDAIAEAEFLVAALTNATYVEPGYLLIAEEGTLSALRFDPQRRKFTGEKLRLAEGVMDSATRLFSHYSVVSGGRLVYQTASADQRAAGAVDLVMMDREGTVRSSVATDGDFWNPRLSHDGRRLAVDITDIVERTYGDIWVLDLERNVRTRLTRHPTDESGPLWSRDDSEVYFYRIPDLYVRDASGVAAERLVWKSEQEKRPCDVSPDGKYLLFSEHGEDGPRLWLLDIQSGQAETWTGLDSVARGARFSPDGSWVAYVSNETGRQEVYLTSFPQADRRIVISDDGGNSVTWSRDGSELFYYSAAQEIVAVPIDWESGDEPRPGNGEPLFRVRLRAHSIEDSASPFNALADGSGFLVNRVDSKGTDAPLVLVQGAFQ